MEEPTREPPVTRADLDNAVKTDRRGRLDLDVRGILALAALIGAFGLSFTQLFLLGSADVPAWVSAIVAGVAGYYFGARSGGTNGHK